MTITLTEMMLFIWAIAMTVLWLRERGESHEFKVKTAIIMKLLAEGKAVFAKDAHGEVEGIVPTKGE